MPGILVALDGSHGSEKALAVAVRMAQEDGQHLTAVAVLDSSGDPRLEQIAARAKTHGRHHLERILQAAVNFARSRGISLTPMLREGHPAEAIVGCAEQEHAKLLVLGGSGTGARHIGLGGTADRVSSHAPCSVLIVK